MGERPFTSSDAADAHWTAGWIGEFEGLGKAYVKDLYRMDYEAITKKSRGARRGRF